MRVHHALTAVMLVAAGFVAGLPVGQAQTGKSMEKVTGIGGVFFKSADPKATREWYQKNLGVKVLEAGGAAVPVFEWKRVEGPDAVAYTIWSPFEKTTDYFAPGASEFMVNYRVDNLDAMLAQLRGANVKVIDGPKDEFNGRFAWIIDIDGRKVELWQPAAGF